VFIFRAITVLIRAVRVFAFYARALLESLGIMASKHHPSSAELAFAKHALLNSRNAVECGPRLDTEFIELATRCGVSLSVFEANPLFCVGLKRRLRRIAASNHFVQVSNIGVSDFIGEMDYFLLNQSFIPNVPFPTLGLRVKVSVTTLDRYFEQRRAPEFIKSDVEGLDLSVFAGAKRILGTLKYFQLEMTSLWKDDYERLFRDFELFLLIDDAHPLRTVAKSNFIRIDEIGWATVFDSMRRGETNVLCGVRKGAPLFQS
jgi:FkbM family methyltransferase